MTEEFSEQMTYEEPAVLSPEQVATLKNKLSMNLINNNTATEEPMPEPDFMQESSISVMDTNTPTVTVDDPIEPATVAMPEEPVAEATVETAAPVEEPKVEETPIYEPEPEKKERKPSRPSIRRPDAIFGDTVLGYRMDGMAVKSRTLYNKTLNSMHHKYWKNGEEVLTKQQGTNVTISAYARYKKDDTPICFMWDEGGNDNGRGFAITVTDADGKMLEPLSVFIPEVEYKYHGDDAVFVNWHHAKLPIAEGYYILSCSIVNDEEGNGNLMIAAHRVISTKLPQSRADGIRPEITAALAGYIVTKGDQMIINPLEDKFIFDENHPAIQALFKQCANTKCDTPAYCHSLITTRGKDFRTYLSDKNFDSILTICDSVDDLNDKVSDAMTDGFSTVCKSENSASGEPQFRQLRLYRICKYYSKTDDIAIFYYLVIYYPKAVTYKERLFHGYAIVNADSEPVDLIGNEEKHEFTFEELKQYITSTSKNDQVISEFRKVY